MKRLAFSDDMMRAISLGFKSMTRRPEKRATPDAKGRMFWKYCPSDALGFPAPSIRWDDNSVHLRPCHRFNDLVAATCAYFPAQVGCSTSYRFKHISVHPHAKIGWKSSRIMPAALAPFVLRITSVRAERLGEITDEDAVREGMMHWGTRTLVTIGPHAPRDVFGIYWNRLYGARPLVDAWTRDRDNWVWVYGFEIEERRIG